MESTELGLWLLPTYGRATTNLPRFFKAAKATGISTPGAVIVDEKDYLENHADYDALDLPDGWTVHIVKGGCCAAATREAMGDLFTPDMKWLGWLADDIVPETPEWDKRTIAHLNGWNIVSTNDGKHAPVKFNGITVWSGDFVRAVGYLFPPGLVHFYLDDVAEEISKATNTWFCDMSIMGRHVHAVDGEKDATFAKTNEHWPEDDLAFQSWRRHEKSEAIERVLALMESYGIEMTKPDFTGMRIMLAVPVGDGRFESVFQRSYVETRDAVRQFGGELFLAEAAYMSDLGMARSKLFGNFLRSDATHLFFIDSDQGWQVKDFIRLLMTKKDFSAAAGVRKVSPPSFAVNVSDDYGRPIPVQHDAVLGLMKVTAVGMAFVCLTRAACERMRQSYPELVYVGADGREDWAVFDSMIFNKRRLSEDYAYCQRWRQIGGEIWVAPEIDLLHVGPNVWSGDWLSQLIQKSEMEKAA